MITRVSNHTVSNHTKLQEIYFWSSKLRFDKGQCKVITAKQIILYKGIYLVLNICQYPKKAHIVYIWFYLFGFKISASLLYIYLAAMYLYIFSCHIIHVFRKLQTVHILKYFLEMFDFFYNHCERKYPEYGFQYLISDEHYKKKLLYNV